MGVYAGLGVSQAIGFFLMGLMFSFLTYYASKELHRVSWNAFRLLDEIDTILGINRARDECTDVFLRNYGM
jgi:hypothetical protein